MIDHRQEFPLPHVVATDPGVAWTKDDAVVIDAPPNAEAELAPEATWPTDLARDGSCGAVAPCVVSLPDGGLRMYYTQILPRPGHPAGANDYDNATTRILSARSQEGAEWKPEPGVRLNAEHGGAGAFRVASPEVVPMSGNRTKLRMYFESCPGTQAADTPIRSALSDDGGKTWNLEPGVRLGGSGESTSAPRLLELEDGRCRLYCYHGGTGIISAISTDGGLTFAREPGVRIAKTLSYEVQTAFAPEVLRIENGGYRMYYAGYADLTRAYILTATSDDGLAWQKHPEPVISPGGRFDRIKCSEMGITPLPSSPGPSYRLFYEACDGTTAEHRGVWRILSASA